MEMALVDGWVRFWHRGEFLPLPGEMQRELEKTQSQLEETQSRLEEMTRRAEAAEREAALLRAKSKNGKN